MSICPHLLLFFFFFFFVASARKQLPNAHNIICQQSAPLPNEIIKSSQLRKKQHLVFTYISENAGIEQ
jgi:hypothetical protein